MSNTHSYSQYTPEIIQAVLAILSLSITYIGLQRDMNARSRRYKINAKIAIGLVALVSLLSIVSAIWTGAESRSDRSKLDSTLISLSKKNDNLQTNLIEANKALMNKLDQTRDTLANQAAEKALLASKQLVNLSTTMQRSILGGTDGLYVAKTVGKADSIFAMVLVNRNNFPHYDISIIRYDYDEICKCPIETLKDIQLVDFTCFNKSKIEVSPTAVGKNSLLNIEPFSFIATNVSYKKYYFFIRSRSVDYIEEYFIGEKKGVYGECFRIFTMDKGKKKILSTINPGNIPIEWEKEFKMMPTYNTYNKHS